jgi:glucose/arabinose dehydrogenase
MRNRFTLAAYAFRRKLQPTLIVLVLGSIGITGTAPQTPPAAGQPQTPPPGGRRGGPPAPGRGNPFPRVQPLPFPDAAQEVETAGPRIRAVPMFKGLASPWSLAFLPNGDMLITEKPGRLRIARSGVLDEQQIAGVPQVLAMGQGGLLEVAIHPKFADNQFVYLTYSKSGEQGNTTALARGRFDGKALVDVRDIFVADNWAKQALHFGSKLAFGRDGMIYMTVGERNDRKRAQDTTNHGGTVLRLKDDGTVPPDNPFVGRTGFKPEIYSYGHRNAQGLTVHPDTGAIWQTEHGPQGGDELNLILPGKNYGWPVVSYGREYPPGGEPISQLPWREEMEAPVLPWVPSIALSGMVFYTGDRFPQWKGNLFVGGLAGLQLQRIGLTERNGLAGREIMLLSLRQRIRDVRQGPDGLLYLVVDANPGGILRLEPVQTATSSQ